MAIQNPNTCGQGFDPFHANLPHHAIITSFGYQYSHSTPVHHVGAVKIHHTYKHEVDQEQNCTVIGNDDFSCWETGRSGSGMRYTSNGLHTLRRYLKSHVRRWMKKYHPAAQ